jgi:hypothetical protein
MRGVGAECLVQVPGQQLNSMDWEDVSDGNYGAWLEHTVRRSPPAHVLVEEEREVVVQQLEPDLQQGGERGHV